MLATPASAATNGETTKTPATTKQHQAERPEHLQLSLAERLERKLDAAERHRSTIRFFAKHRRLLESPRHRAVARAALRRAHRRLARVTRDVAAIRRALRRQQARRLAGAPPRVAICHVFGRRYCHQALSVAWCESRHSTTAQNGQYLGLFQMGWSERRLFGHGRTAFAQAKAAHRYFVRSGRDWSPWSCRPGYV